jgi:hypothetical protein
MTPIEITWKNLVQHADIEIGSGTGMLRGKGCEHFPPHC